MVLLSSLHFAYLASLTLQGFLIPGRCDTSRGIVFRNVSRVGPFPSWTGYGYRFSSTDPIGVLSSDWVRQTAQLRFKNKYALETALQLRIENRTVTTH